MRILLALAVVVVFAALMILDTTALVRLTIVCVTGGCGVPVLWIAIGGGVLGLAALLSFRLPVAKLKPRAKPRRGAKLKPSPKPKSGVKSKPEATVKQAAVRKAGQPPAARAKAIAQRKPKQAK
jgi:hypothetical protein